MESLLIVLVIVGGLAYAYTLLRPLFSKVRARQGRLRYSIVDLATLPVMCSMPYGLLSLVVGDGGEIALGTAIMLLAPLNCLLWVWGVMYLDAAHVERGMVRALFLAIVVPTVIFGPFIFWSCAGVFAEHVLNWYEYAYLRPGLRNPYPLRWSGAAAAVVACVIAWVVARVITWWMLAGVKREDVETAEAG